MKEYVFLLYPAINQVYNESSVQLTLGELGVFNECFFEQRLQHIEEVAIAGSRYIRFRAEELCDRELAQLAHLSSMYVLFERNKEGWLQPLPLQPSTCFPSDLVTIPKYKGKTNEHFTKLLMNVTVASSAFASQFSTRDLFILDPVAGRGTTLNQALTYGWNAAGIDVDKRDMELYKQYLTTYFKRKRLKHKLQTSQVREGKKPIAQRFDFEVGLSKEEFQAGNTLRVTGIQADTTTASRYFKANTFHALVADLPYGVQHGSHGNNPKAKALSRRPLAFLETTLPVWLPLLKSGGTIGLGWNRHVAGREKVTNLLKQHSLTVLESPSYLSFRHVVDQSITRDIIVARKAPNEAETPAF